jgi:hypothetical protein
VNRDPRNRAGVSACYVLYVTSEIQMPGVTSTQLTGRTQGTGGGDGGMLRITPQEQPVSAINRLLGIGINVACSARMVKPLENHLHCDLRRPSLLVVPHRDACGTASGHGEPDSGGTATSTNPARRIGHLGSATNRPRQIHVVVARRQVIKRERTATDRDFTNQRCTRIGAELYRRTGAVLYADMIANLGWILGFEQAAVQVITSFIEFALSFEFGGTPLVA